MTGHVGSPILRSACTSFFRASSRDAFSCKAKLDFARPERNVDFDLPSLALSLVARTYSLAIVGFVLMLPEEKITAARRQTEHAQHCGLLKSVGFMLTGLFPCLAAWRLCDPCQSVC